MVDLQETQHELFRLPANKDIPIWRYMDLAKYLAMLDRGSLFFARATLLGDPFEGSTTNMMVAQREYIKKIELLIRPSLHTKICRTRPLTGVMYLRS